MYIHTHIYIYTLNLIDQNMSMNCRAIGGILNGTISNSLANETNERKSYKI